MYKIVMVWIEFWSLSVRMNLMVLVIASGWWLSAPERVVGRLEPLLMSWYIRHSVKCVSRSFGRCS